MCSQYISGWSDTTMGKKPCLVQNDEVELRAGFFKLHQPLAICSALSTNSVTKLPAMFGLSTVTTCPH